MCQLGLQQSLSAAGLTLHRWNGWKQAEESWALQASSHRRPRAFISHWGHWAQPYAFLLCVSLVLMRTERPLHLTGSALRLTGSGAFFSDWPFSQGMGYWYNRTRHEVPPATVIGDSATVTAPHLLWLCARDSDLCKNVHSTHGFSSWVTPHTRWLQGVRWPGPSSACRALWLKWGLWVFHRFCLDT